MLQVPKQVFPLQPMKKTMVKQVLPLQSMEGYARADIHTLEDPTLEQVDVP